jgi:GT2 family glycosyltransferase/tetratricopeptide (TPR) repeat protein/glycosyltransferase involved in cell wall biosynthesis
MDWLRTLALNGFDCRAFCASKCDLPDTTDFERMLNDRQLPVRRLDMAISDQTVRLLSVPNSHVPVTVFPTHSTRIDQWVVDEPQAIVSVFERVLSDFRPDVLLTYGGDPVTQAMIRLARERGIAIVFGLHNFAYQDAALFQSVDDVLVPSEFSRRWYRQKLGLECTVLPYAIDWGRVEVKDQQAQTNNLLIERRHLTFVNPQPAKGLYFFARIAEQLPSRIPILVVESRGSASWLEQVPIDLSSCENLHAMANTHDPRDFYRVTKLLVMPSLWNESFGLVATEAMINGIPVLASDRGALPETLGSEEWGRKYGEATIPDTLAPTSCPGGFLLHVPQRYSPDTTTVPTAKEVEPWVQTIVRLWDKEQLYREASHHAQSYAQRWHPDRMGPTVAEFFHNVVTRSTRSARELKAANKDMGKPTSPRTASNGELPSPPPHLTSIILVTHNQLEHTRLCIESIVKHTVEPYELIVIDNGSMDGTARYVKEAIGGARGVGSVDKQSPVVAGMRPVRLTLAVNAENRGFPAAVNQGIRAATGRQLVLLNNDTIVTAGWLSRMLHVLDDNQPDHLPIGLVGPCSNFVSGPQQINVTYAPPGPVNIAECDYAKLEEFATAWGQANEGRTQTVDRLVGFCLLICREVVEKIGLFDERFGIGNFEDDDYCRRAREAGFKLVIACDAFVHHFGGATFRSSDIDFGELMRRNEIVYRAKWGDAAEPAGGIRSDIAQQASASVSLCMIARDNERTIKAALESVRDCVEDIVVVDTGSVDRTPEIAASLDARVFHFPWCDDFSAARNESIRHARGQWIFWIDTDDAIDAENRRKLQALIRQIALDPPPADTVGFLMKVRCPGSGSNGRHGAVCVDHVKLFRNRPELRFEFRIHEQILLAIRRAGGQVAWTDIVIDHAGSDQSPEGRARKLERDLRILVLEYHERPDHPFTLFNLGMTHEHAGNYEQAIGFLWQSIGRAADDESHLRKAYAILVSSYRQLGRHQTAWDTCQKGLKQFPDDVELRFREASLHQYFGRLHEAARAYEELRGLQAERRLSSVDDGLQGHLAGHHLATVYMELGELTRAEQMWRQVVWESSWFAPAWQALGNLLLQQGKLDAVLECAAALDADSLANSRDAARLRRSVLVGRGEVQAARAELDQALAERPGDADLVEERCQLLFEYFPPAEAQTIFEELVRADPANASGHHNLGTIHYKLCRFDEAAVAYRRSLAIRPHSASTNLHLGYALREAGRPHEAIAAWQRVLELQPNEPHATEAIRQVTREQ